MGSRRGDVHGNRRAETRGVLASLLTKALPCRINGKPVCAKKAGQRINIIAHFEIAESLTSEGETMRSSYQRVAQAILFLALALLPGTVGYPAMAQEKKVAQANGVDNSKMGPYRALAQHIYLDFQKGDIAGAAAMGRVLERVWDKAEDYGGDTALSKTNRKLFDEIDKAMDDFLTPIWEAKGKPPDAAKVKAAYNAYLEKLKLAD